MAKLFYSLEEAAAKLGKTPNEVRELATSGQLPEFRDRDRLMFKVEHVDLLAGTDKDEELIPLADSGELEPLSVSPPQHQPWTPAKRTPKKRPASAS